MPGRFPSVPRPSLDFGYAADFGGAQADRNDSDAFLHPTVAPPPTLEKDVLPRIDVGPFHATLSGVGNGRSDMGGEQLDNRDFWNSSVSGSVDGRGATVTFTLPTQ
jgi:hypothetical protein